MSAEADPITLLALILLPAVQAQTAALAAGAQGAPFACSRAHFVAPNLFDTVDGGLINGQG